MTRRTLSVVAALSLLLCLSTAALWVRSYFARDYLRLTFVPGRQRHGVLL